MGFERSVRARVEVLPEGPGAFRLQVDDGRSRTSHRVTLSPEEQERYAPGVPPVRLVEEAFRFLLEREPAASILANFALSTIERYFPEFPVEIRRRLGLD